MSIANPLHARVSGDSKVLILCYLCNMLVFMSVPCGRLLGWAGLMCVVFSCVLLLSNVVPKSSVVFDYINS